MRHNCVACILESKKIKARNAPAHTCAKADPKYREPDTCTISDQKHFKVKIYDQLYCDAERTLFRLEHQYLNGCKVKRFTEMWLNGKNFRLTLNKVDQYIWVPEDVYLKLVFL
jgi:hypothetical protein